MIVFLSSWGDDYSFYFKDLCSCPGGSWFKLTINNKIAIIGIMPINMIHCSYTDTLNNYSFYN